MEDVQSKSRTLRWHWYLFCLLVVAAYLPVVAAKTQWAEPAGYLVAPTAIGYFIIRRGGARGKLAASYGMFVVLLTSMAGVAIMTASDDAAASINGGCLNQLPSVAKLQNEGDKKLFCSCIAENMKWPIMRNLAIATLSFREPTPIRDDRTLAQLGLEVTNQCVAKLPAR